MREEADHPVALTDESIGQSAEVMERIFSATRPGVVFGQPVVSGAYTVITASEVAAGGGFGFGRGFGPARPTTRPETPSEEGSSASGREGLTGGGGGGGGGGSTGRPVAIVVIGPDGVQVKPVVDVTKLAIAGLTAFAAMMATLGRIRRASR